MQPAADATASKPKSRFDLSGVSWALYDAGRLPYVSLVSGAVFIPYFATQIIGDPVEGQAQVASFAKTAGFIAAFTAPLLGACLDALGPRKPWIAACTAAMVVLVAMLWFAQPGPAGLSVGAIIAILVGGKLLYNYTEMMHNSLLPRAAAGNVSKMSGLSLALGSASGVIVLSFVLFAFAMPGTTDWAFIPDRPLFGLDPARFENLRIVGPIAAALLAVMVTPLLLFARDFPPSGVPLGVGLANGVRSLAALPARLRGHRDAAIFLFSRMIYADGTAALTVFGGVYAAGVMGWKATELLVLGILQLAASGIGGLNAARMDALVGPKRNIQLCLTIIIGLLIAMVGMGPDRLFYVWAWSGQPLWSAPLFETLPQVVFLAIMLSVTFFAAGVSSSSRVLLTHLSPAEESGAFFGLYALAGTATAWLAPLAIEWATRATGEQRLGFTPVVIFFVIGLIGLSRVQGPAKAPVVGEIRPAR